MKVSSAITYNICCSILKFSGYTFYSVEQVAGRMKYHQRWTDFTIFTISLLLNLTLLLFTGDFNMKIKVRSEILLMGSKVLFNVSMFSVIFTKFINFVGQKKTFEIIESFWRVDKKVC
jgi:hypothetical protein